MRTACMNATDARECNSVSVRLCVNDKEKREKGGDHVRDVLARKQVRLGDLDPFHLG